MNESRIKEYWKEKRKRLKRKYPDLTDDDLTCEAGKKMNFLNARSSGWVLPEMNQPYDSKNMNMI